MKKVYNPGATKHRANIEDIMNGFIARHTCCRVIYELQHTV